MISVLAAILMSAPAEKLFINGAVFDGTKWQPTGTAVLIEGEKILAIGKESSLRTQSANAEIIDLKGKALLPGFNDTHLHPASLFEEESPYARIWLDPSKTPTMESLIARLKWKAERTPKGSWIIGYGYQETKLGKQPTREDLDKASTDHPIYMSHSSGHVGVCNTYALKLSGVTRETPTPAGGVIGKDTNGEPNGYFGESAQKLIKGRQLPKAPPEEAKAALVNCLQAFSQYGITSAGVAGTDPKSLQTYQELDKEGRLPLRLNVMISESNWTWLADQWKAGERGNDHIRIGDVKVFHGNSLSGNTCWLSRPRLDGNLGVPPGRTQAELDKLILGIHRAGLRACTHSNGDREIDMVISAIENAEKVDPKPDSRHRIEHCSCVTPELLRRMKSAGITMIPHSYEWEHGDKMAKYGKDWLDWMCPNGSALAAKIPFAGHSDYPVSAADPMLRIQSLVTRKSAEGMVVGPKQKIALDAALQSWTQSGAYATHEESKKGRIAPGQFADLVVLASDPRKCPADDLRKIAVQQTFMGGKKVFDSRLRASRTRTLSQLLTAQLVDDCPEHQMPKLEPLRNSKWATTDPVKSRR